MKLLTTILSLVAISTYAQVGIGTNSPNPATILDITSSNQGVLLPRIELEDTKTFSLAGNLNESQKKDATSLIVYNTANRNDVNEGFYYWVQKNENDGRWINFSEITKSALPKIFYMPSISLDASVISDTEKSIDLHSLYERQYTQPKVKSPSAKSKITSYSKEELEYYVTFYDEDVFKVLSIDDNGIMKYKVIGTPTTNSFMNIVFVVK